MSNNKSVVTFGNDLAKSLFHVCGLDADGKRVVSTKLRRTQIVTFFANQSPCVVAMEAYSGAHWLGRKFNGLGCQVRIPPAQYVKPFLQNQKNDANDALAIAGASQRPSVRPAPIKTQPQLHLQALHRVRDRLVNQRTRLINQMRRFLLEEGVILRTDVGNFKSQLPAVLSDPSEEISPAMTALINELWNELLGLEARLKSISSQIQAWAG